MRHSRSHPLILTALLASVAVAAYFTYSLGFFPRVLAKIHMLGPWGAALYAAFFVIATLAFAPILVLMMTGGALFGPVAGTIAVSAGSIAASMIVFWMSRHFARDWVVKKMRGHLKTKAIYETVSEEGWRMVLLLRLAPIFPFNVLNAAFGLTKIPAKQFFLASWLGMLPGTVVNVYLGSLAGGAITGNVPQKKWEWLLFGASFLITWICVFYAGLRIKKSLAVKTPPLERNS